MCAILAKIIGLDVSHARAGGEEGEDRARGSWQRREMRELERCRIGRGKRVQES